MLEKEKKTIAAAMARVGGSDDEFGPVLLKAAMRRAYIEERQYDIIRRVTGVRNTAPMN